MIPADLQLETSLVLLRPLRHEDFSAFYELTSNDAEPTVWNQFSKNLSNEDDLIDWMATAYKERALDTRRPFTIVIKETGEIAGSMSFGNISNLDKRLEIGWSWLGQHFRGKEFNMHAKFALLRYAFEVAQFERVEFKTGIKNARARTGLLKLGAKEEGILRSHMLLWTGERRTSVMYSILKEEWSSIQQTNFKDIE